MKIGYSTTCRDCDWTPDPQARAGVETQIAKHLKANAHCVVTLGRPTYDDAPTRERT